MPIPINPLRISLTAATPTPLTVDGLKDQLNVIGLTCDQAAIELLAGYIVEVKSKIPDPPGGAQAWAILQPAASNSAVAEAAGALQPLELVTGLLPSTVGNWLPDQTALGYSSQLEYIQYASHFDWLKAQRPSFTGVGPTTNSYSGTNLTIDAIKTQFELVATSASAALVKGINRDAMESALSNAIAPLKEQSKDYNVEDSRTVFLVDDYNPSTQQAAGIGVLTVSWKLDIQDYATKKGPVPLQHNFQLRVEVRAVMYDDINVLNADYAAVQSNFGTKALAVSGSHDLFSIPVVPTSVTIYEARPPAVRETFNSGLPIRADQNKASVLVLYAPDLQNIGSIDNSASAATASYSKTVETGFTFSMTQTLSITASVEVSIEVVKAGVSVGFSLSFTEQWSSSTSETISIEVPANKKAFLYQGFLLASVLTFDPQGSGSYSYGQAARCLSPVVVTSEKPLVGVATMST